MTTTYAPIPHSTTETAASLGARPTTLARVLRSEWIKLRGLKSTWITLAATFLAVVVLGVVAAFMATNGSASSGPLAEARSPLATVLLGANLSVLIVAVLGSVIGAREFGSGSILLTLTAVPKRLPVLWGKILAFAAAVAPVIVIGLIAAFLLGTAVLSSGGAATVAWTDDGVVRTVLGTAYSVLGLGVIGLGIGVMLRSTAPAIAIVIGAVIFLPALATELLPSSWNVVLQYLPSNAIDAFTSLNQAGSALLSPVAGLLVFTGWVAAAVVGAAVTLIQRDA